MNNIEILENFIDKQKSNKGTFVPTDFEIKSLENIIQENEELKEENNRIKSLDYTTLAEEMEMGLWMPRADVEEYYIPIENLNDYIPKSKVKEKIEEYERKLKQPGVLNINTAAYSYYLGKKEGWEELLKEGE